MNHTFLIPLVCLCSAVLYVCESVKFGQLCSGNSSNRRRTSDGWGQGHYGARRYGNPEKNGPMHVCMSFFLKCDSYSIHLVKSLILTNWLLSGTLNSLWDVVEVICLKGRFRLCRSLFQWSLTKPPQSIFIVFFFAPVFLFLRNGHQHLLAIVVQVNGGLKPFL